MSERIVITSREQPGQTGLNYTLDLLALPEYKKRDSDLSRKLADKFTVSLKNKGINNCSLQVTDGYINEEEPHYQLNARFGDDTSNFLKRVSLSVSYSATADAESFNGLIQIVVSVPGDSIDSCKVLETEAFEYYNELMEEVYPEWKTVYDQAGIQFTEISD